MLHSSRIWDGVEEHSGKRSPSKGVPGQMHQGQVGRRSQGVESAASRKFLTLCKQLPLSVGGRDTAARA